MIGAGASFLSHARNALDFFLNSGRLFFVMGMTKRLFEELTDAERIELDAQCDIWQADAIAAQDADMVAEEMARQSDALIAEDAERDLMIAES
tara:strand:- start:88 stop:366 length:279 start_codon:yes stop_codon:yes gene_type:complete